MEMKKNEIVTMDGNNSLVADMTTAQLSYCSIKVATVEDKKALFKIMNNPDGKLDEFINMRIALKDVYAETLTFVNDETGEVVPGVRIVLVDKDGVSYGCCAGGVYNAIKKLIAVFGEPTWEEPIEVIPYTIPSKRVPNGKVLTLKLAD